VKTVNPVKTELTVKTVNPVKTANPELEAPRVLQEPLVKTVLKVHREPKVFLDQRVQLVMLLREAYLQATR
jgi:hypothetical protein